MKRLFNLVYLLYKVLELCCIFEIRLVLNTTLSSR